MSTLRGGTQKRQIFSGAYDVIMDDLKIHCTGKLDQNTVKKGPCLDGRGERGYDDKTVNEIHGGEAKRR